MKNLNIREEPEEGPQGSQPTLQVQLGRCPMADLERAEGTTYPIRPGNSQQELVSRDTEGLHSIIFIPELLIPRTNTCPRCLLSYRSLSCSVFSSQLSAARVFCQPVSPSLQVFAKLQAFYSPTGQRHKGLGAMRDLCNGLCSPDKPTWIMSG